MIAKFIGAGKTLVTEATLVGLASGILLLCVKAASYFRSPPTPFRAGLSVPRVWVGVEVTLKAAEFARHPVSFLLVTSPKCDHSIRSVGFHQRVAVEAQRQQIPFYVIVPEPQDANAYLGSLGVSVAAAKRWPDLNPQVWGTPTIIAVDSTGAARRVWLGAVQPEDERAILNIIRTPSLLNEPGASGESPLSSVRNYSREELKEVSVRARVELIDPREREVQGARKDVIVMPLLELPTRAKFELNKAHLQVVDCSNLSESHCAQAVSHLARMGFRVATLGAGLFHRSCQATPAGT
jgi:hypothetical protein